MRNILLLGAGRSSSWLIRYLLEHADAEKWLLSVGDVSIESAEAKINGHPKGRALAFDVHNEAQLKEEIKKADIVISLLPPALHIIAAEKCVELKKNLVTASYVSPEIKALNEAALQNGILLLNEMGLDPGIDHMSAMKVIDEVKSFGGQISSFKSYCGGLIAPESNDNPWGYKITWNPRNVINAGKGTAQYQEDGQLKLLPYNRLFSQTETVNIKGSGAFEAYANRDSLSYQDPYGLHNIPTLLRGTLRYPGFCAAWDALILLGLTDDTARIANSEKLSYKQFTQAYIPASISGKDVKSKLAKFLGQKADSAVVKAIEWTGLFENNPIGLPNATAAEILQHLLEQKWVLKDTDKDLVVMQHQFVYMIHSKIKRHISSMVVTGEDTTYTAMAKTVGLPMAIATKLILNGQIKLTGVQIPTNKIIYEPVLKELETLGIAFTEEMDLL